MATVNKTTFVVSEFIITGFDDVPYSKLVGTAILLTVSLILLGSLTNIGVIMLNKQLHTPMYFCLCTLAMVDIIYTLSICVTMLNVLLGEEKRISFVRCIFQHFLFHLGSFMEPLTIALMALDRLIAISRPLRYQSILTTSNILILIAVIWAIGCIFSGAWSVLVNYLPYCNTNILKYCFCEFATLVRAACVDPSYYFTIASIVYTVIVFGNFFLIIFSYMWIIYEVMKSAPKDRWKMFTTCSSHLIVVACFFIPKFLLVLVTRVGLVLTLPQRNGLIISSTLGPSLVNPYIYCLRNKEIWSRLLSIFKSRSKVNGN